MEGKRRQKGEQLILAKSWWNRQVKAGVSFQGRRKYEIEGKNFSEYDRNAETKEKGTSRLKKKR